MVKYFYTDGVNKFGPFTKDELINQKIARNTKIWYFGLENWTEIYKIEELNDIILKIPPELNSCFLSTNDKTERKSYLKENKLKKIIKKNIIRITIFLLIIICVIRIVQLKINNNEYKEIVKNSYETKGTFDIYIDKFYRDLEFSGIYPKKPKTTIIKFSRLDQIENTTHIHGISYGKDDDDRIEIYINPSSWNKFSKPMRYFLMYHELSHDILNVEDLDKKPINEGKLMYPVISSYENKSMDEFIESFHALFEEQAENTKK